MNRTQFKLTKDELGLLATLPGAAWDHYGGEAVADGGAYALGAAFVVTSVGAVTLRADMRVANVEGFDEEYTELVVVRGAEGERRALARGGLYYFLRGERVLSVYVVRDEVRASRVGDVEFEFVSDSGIVVVTEGGSLGITLGGPFTPDLFITRGSRDEVPHLHDGTQAWESDLEIEYECRRTLIPVQDLLD